MAEMAEVVGGGVVRNQRFFEIPKEVNLDDKDAVADWRVTAYPNPCLVILFTSAQKATNFSFRSDTDYRLENNDHTLKIWQMSETTEWERGET